LPRPRWPRRCQSVSNSPRVPSEELDFDDDQVFHYQGMPFTGVAYEEESGGDVSETAYAYGLLEGASRVWHSSGSLKSEAAFYRGAGHGRARKFREDGTLESETIYEFGIVVRSSEFDESGNVVGRFELSEDSPNHALLQAYRAEFEG
jgi:antitoxin component YwqK of YwqJK toxin-antitoxin module